LGVLFVSVQLPRELQPDEIHLLVTLSEMAGNAIRRADLHGQTERQVQRLASLRAVDMAINTILDLRVTLGILIDHIISQLKVDAVNILLINPSTQTLYHAASSGFRSDAIRNTQLYIGDSLASQAIHTRSTVYIPDLNQTRFLPQVRVLTGEGFVTYFGVPLIAKGQIKGILETFQRSLLEPDSEWRNFLETLAGQAAIAIDNSMLFEELQQTNLNLSLAYDATIEGWSKALDLRDQETEGHTIRVTQTTLQLADKLGINATEMVHIRRGALLHDIGKMGVPDSILHKAGPLTEEEWVIMRRHPEFAHNMLSSISYLRQALDIPYSHHERWDGSGYPRHLVGEQIPQAARLFAVVDVWDALLSDRPYRKSWTREATIEYIRTNSGVLFDPQVVDVFLHMVAS
jgi:putative nucleotidyltransferase with HDIG domain